MMHSRNLLLALLPPLFWGVGFTLTKPASAHFQPLFMMLLVYAVIALIMLVAHREMPKTPWLKLTVIAAFSVTIQGALMFSALAYVEATTANLVLQTQVPIAILLGWLLLGEALDGRKILGTAIALTGVAIVIGLPQERPPLLPVLAVIAAGATWALGQVLTRLWSRDSGLMVLKANALFGVPQLLVATLVLERGQWQSIVSATPLDWFYLAFVCFIGFYAAYAAWFTLLKRVRVDEATPFVMLMTPIGVISAVVLLGETLHWPQVVGGIILLIGLAIVSGVLGRRVVVR
ncbi:DMT family transporter [Aestuariivirga sp.]|uniref:DMT family transporter n=1 Tax=Aestuariivirga sp. TaxID=2650926 RepID=UPI0039E4B538